MKESTNALCQFLDASPTSFHAADNIRSYLLAHGAQELDEAASWQIEPGVPYFVCRSGTSIVAFRAGLKSMGDAGLVIAGAHTDSPGLKVRPGTHKQNQNMVRIGVDVYGGAIVSTWLDRPLAVAGRLFLRDSESPASLKSVLYNSGKPVGIIPNLAIHLNRDVNRGFEYSPAQHLPVLVSSLREKSDTQSANLSWLHEYIGEDTNLDIEPGDIVASDLFFYDTQKSAIFGTRHQSALPDDQERDILVNAPHLDDLAGCHAILEAFSSAVPSEFGQVACFLDSEEIGSMTMQGADSSFVRDVLARLAIVTGAGAEDFYRMSSRSLFVSLDAAQGWNPAYPEKYDEKLSPLLGAGPAVKINANQRYATESHVESLIAIIANQEKIPLQRYMSRADMQPGTTIGPMSAARLGIRTIDIGHPLLSMHSIRETINSFDHAMMIRLLAAVYKNPPIFS